MSTCTNRCWPLWLMAALLGVLEMPRTARADTLVRRDSHPILPAPLSIHPDQNWDGIDGNWSTFTLGVGTPAQYVRVYASTASQQVWAVDRRGCEWTNDTGNCVQTRGWTFDYTKSTTWQTIGTYALYIGNRLGLYGNADYGYDTVSLGGYGEGGPELKDVVVGSEANLDYYLGIFGLNPQPTNFTKFQNNSASYMTKLKEALKIPSLSYGYTAGAKYRGNTGVLASLTLGGYDASRLIQNNLLFRFAPDSDRQLVVVAQRIAVSSNSPQGFNGSSPSTNMLMNSSPLVMSIDSTVAGIWLPPSALASLETKFGLVWDTAAQLYLLNDTQYAALSAAAPNFTFTIGVSAANSQTVEITLPYAALDQWAISPFQNMTTNSRYLPFHRASSENQYTLGRAFLQEAYLSVDHEHQLFNLSAVNWYSGPTPDIATTYPLDTSMFPQSSSLSAGAIAGIVIGIIAGLALLVLAALFLYRRRRASKATGASGPVSRTLSGRTAQTSMSHMYSSLNPGAHGSSASVDGNVIPKAELDAGYTPSYAHSLEPPGSSRQAYSSTLPSPRSPLSQVHVSQRTVVPPVAQPVYEMPGDTPVPQELPSPQVGETAKEADIRRETEFNGLTTPLTPTVR